MRALLAILFFVPFLAVAQNPPGQGNPMDEYWENEGAYWLLGVENDHQRYSGLCGVYRQTDDNRPLTVIRVTQYHADGTVTGERVDNATISEISTNDLEYVHGALAVSNLCAEIAKVLTEAQADNIQNNRLDAAGAARIVPRRTDPAYAIPPEDAMWLQGSPKRTK